jgi:hypothetical protein
VKLFQIEEPEGGPADPSVPGAAIGIDASGAEANVAFSLGGNAEILVDRDGFARAVPVPTAAATAAQWQEVLAAVKVRAERALARPVTHAVILLAEAPGAAIAERLRAAAAEAGIEVLRLVTRAELPSGSIPMRATAVLAEDLAPRPE